MQQQAINYLLREHVDFCGDCLAGDPCKPAIGALTDPYGRDVRLPADATGQQWDVVRIGPYDHDTASTILQDIAAELRQS